MNSVLSLSVLGLLTLALVKSQNDSFTQDFRKVNRKRSTDSKIDPICLEEDRRSLKKIAELRAEILSLKKEVNEENNRTDILKKENLELNQRIQELVGFLDQDGTLNIFNASKKGSLKGLNYWYSKDPSSIHAKDGNNYHWTPLYYASRFGHLEIVEFLLSKGVDLEAEDSNFNVTPLMRASWDGRVPIVKALLDKGANINYQNKYKWTPLHSAVDGNELPAVQVLIERGADRSLRDEENRTPLDLARERGFKSIVDYLSSF